MKQAIKLITKAITDRVVFAAQKLKSFLCRDDSQQNKAIDRIIAEGVKAHAEVFTGLYEPMHMVASGRLDGKLGAFDEWCLRSGNINDGTSYSEIFVSRFSDFRNWDDIEFIKNAQLILHGISKAGVIRDSFNEFRVDGNTCLRYGTLDGREINEGEVVHVLMPCWHIDDLILEKGILK
jgi:hypothetical protein